MASFEERAHELARQLLQEREEATRAAKAAYRSHLIQVRYAMEFSAEFIALAKRHLVAPFILLTGGWRKVPQPEWLGQRWESDHSSAVPAWVVVPYYRSGFSGIAVCEDRMGYFYKKTFDNKYAVDSGPRSAFAGDDFSAASWKERLEVAAAQIINGTPFTPAG